MNLLINENSTSSAATSPQPAKRNKSKRNVSLSPKDVTTSNHDHLGSETDYGTSSASHSSNSHRIPASAQQVSTGLYDVEEISDAETDAGSDESSLPVRSSNPSISRQTHSPSSLSTAPSIRDSSNCNITRYVPPSSSSSAPPPAGDRSHLGEPITLTRKILLEPPFNWYWLNGQGLTSFSSVMSRDGSGEKFRSAAEMKRSGCVLGVDYFASESEAFDLAIRLFGHEKNYVKNPKNMGA